MHNTNSMKFYNGESEEMKQRSEKDINSISSSNLIQETIQFIDFINEKIIFNKMFNKMFNKNKIFTQKQTQKENITTISWNENLINTKKDPIEFMPHGIRKDCDIRLSLVIYLNKWRFVINNSNECLPWRNVILENLLLFKKNLIQDLKEGNRYELCGCNDIFRQSKEDHLWEMTQSHGPGHYEDFPIFNQEDANSIEETLSLWVVDEDINIEEHEKKNMEELMSWRHDLNKQVEMLNLQIDYFIRIPHKVYQSEYFKLASRIPQVCADIVISYL